MQRNIKQTRSAGPVCAVQMLLCLAAVMLPPLALAESQVDYGAGVTLGMRDLDFDFDAIALPSFIVDADNNIVIPTGGGDVEFDISETLYTAGIWGGIFYHRFHATALVELAAEEDTNIGTYTEEFVDLGDSRASELSRVDYSITLGYEVWRGLSIFGGWRHAEFEAKAKEQNFLLGFKDQTYVEEGLFLGSSYVWHVGDVMSLSFSVAYANLEVDFSEDNVDRETTLGPVSFGEFAYTGNATGLSYGVQATVPVTPHWYFTVSAKHQRYESNNNSTALPVFPRIPGLVATPTQVIELDTQHTDTLLNVGLQYIF